MPSGIEVSGAVSAMLQVPAVGLVMVAVSVHFGEASASVRLQDIVITKLAMVVNPEIVRFSVRGSPCFSEKSGVDCSMLVFYH